MKKEKYLLVDSSILPDIYHKVIEAKRLLNSGKCSCVSDAVKRTGISRSAYYKYKDYVFPFYEMSKEKILTLYILMEDRPGIMSDFLNTLARAGANILTINQNIPDNGAANITVSIQTGNLKTDIETLLEKIRRRDGILKAGFVAKS